MGAYVLRLVGVYIFLFHILVCLKERKGIKGNNYKKQRLYKNIGVG